MKTRQCGRGAGVAVPGGEAAAVVQAEVPHQVHHCGQDPAPAVDSVLYSYDYCTN